MVRESAARGTEDRGVQDRGGQGRGAQGRGAAVKGPEPGRRGRTHRAGGGTGGDSTGGAGTGGDAVDAAAGGDELSWAARVQRLEGEVAGLRQAMRTRGLIEQAKGMLAERFSCDPEEAFGYLSRLSQDANVRVVDIAADVVGSPRLGSPETGQDEQAGGAAPGSPPAPQAAGATAPARARESAPVVTPLPADLSRRFRRAAAAAQAATGMSELADALLRDGLAALHGSAAVIYQREPDGALGLLGAAGWPAEAVSDWQRIPSGVKTAIGQVVRLGRALWLTGAEQEDFLPVGPGAARAVFPLRVADRVAGAVELIWPQVRTFDEPEQRYLSALAGVAEREAARLWERGTGSPGALGEGPGWLPVVLDAGYAPVQVLSPVRDDAGTVVDFVIDHCNPAAAEGTGRQPRDILGRRLLDLYPYLLANGVFESYRRVLEEGVGFSGDAVPETVVVNGRPQQIVISRRAVRFGDGLLVTWQRLDRELRREQQVARMEALGRFGWADWDLGGTETYWSPGMYAVLGRDPARGPLALDQLPSLALPEDLPAVENLVRRVVERGQEGSAEFRIRRDGQVRYLRAVVEPRLDPRGRTGGAGGLVQDVSDEWLAHDQVRRVQQQLAEQRIRLGVEQALTQQMREVLYPTSELGFEVPGARVAARHLLPAGAADVRGDFCDATVLPGGDVVLTIGDIFGSGVQAAATMSRLLYPIRAMGLAGTPPGQILALLNTDLRHDAEPPLASVLVARYVRESGCLVWAQAGHLAPAVLTAGQARLLDRPAGVALGLLPQPRYAESELRLRPGDIVACYTDGVVYGRTDAGGDPLAALLTRLRHAARRGGLAAVLDQCLQPRADEACLLALQATAD
jgi:PAS domain-containing protein